MNQSIIDPHIHLWDPRRTPRETSAVVKLLGWHPKTMLWAAQRVFPGEALRFFGRPDYLMSDYLPEQYRADTSDREVTGFVHVEATWKGKGPLGPVDETRWLESLDAPLLKGIVGYAELSLGAGVDAVLAAHVAASSRFRGIRYSLAHDPHPGVWNACDVAGLAYRKEWRKGYALLAKHGLSFDTFVYHHQLGDVAALAQDFPEIPVTLCHAGTPTAYGGPFGGAGESATERREISRAWRDGMSRLAELPNVVVKISGLGMPVVGWDYHGRQGGEPTATQVATNLQPIVDFIVDTFGAQRCMFASNFPIDKVSMPWATLYQAYQQTVESRSEEDRAALFHGTAARVYRLGRAGGVQVLVRHGEGRRPGNTHNSP